MSHVQTHGSTCSVLDLLMTTATCAYNPTHVRQLEWNEDPHSEFSQTENNVNTQYINAHFIDIEKGVEDIGEAIVDVKLPYDRILPTNEERFNATRNHIVGCAVHRGDLTALSEQKKIASNTGVVIQPLAL